MKHFDILSLDTNIFGKRFLEASAGTGKTFAIEHLVVRLLREGSLSLDQILVVTFTRAATRDLKMRIRANLSETELISFDRAQIFTIHGFCHRMLSEFAFEAGVAFDLEQQEPEEEKSLIKNFLLEKLQGYSPAQISHVMRRFDLVEALFKKKCSNTKIPSFREIHEMFNDRLKPCSVVEELLKYTAMTDPDFRKQAIILETLLANRSSTEEEFDALIRPKKCFLEGMEASKLKVKFAKMPPRECTQKILPSRLCQSPGVETIDKGGSINPIQPPLSMTQPRELSHQPGGQNLLSTLPYHDFEKMRSELLPLIRLARDPDAIFERIAQDWKKERKGALSYDDLLEQMEKSIENPLFAERIQKKYRAVIVDEFQDTDPIQWNIFHSLFSDQNLAAFYLVGDPKQSIYAFRQADIYTFFKAAEIFGKENSAHLDINFRSKPALVQALNLLFCSKDWMSLPALGQMLPVTPVRTARTEEGGHLHFFVSEGPDAEENDFFPFIASKIPENEETVAILVKDRYQGQRMHNYLQRWNIPSSVKKGDCLEGLSAMKDLLTAVLEPEDASAVKKALSSPLFNSDMGRDKFVEWNEILEQKGFAAFYGDFLHETIEHIVSLPDLSLYHDLNFIYEHLSQQKDILALLPSLEELKEVEIEKEAEGVQIMTIHASKGLEFDIVFALGLASRYPDSNEELDAEKMRQLYVAMTRAKSELYVPLIHDGDGTSPIEIFWQKAAPDLEQFSYTRLKNMQFNLQKRARSREMELLPPAKLPPRASPQYLLSFSSLSQTTAHEIFPPENTLPIGAETGIIVHSIFEKFFSSSTDLAELIAKEVEGTHLIGWEETLRTLVDQTLQLDIDGFTLLDVPKENMLTEMEFLFPAKDTFLKGFIDLCFEFRGKYYVLDWKTNWLENYSDAAVLQAMKDGDYLLQGAIYGEALQRYLEYFDPIPFGGAIYIFVRGPKAFHFYPEQELL